MRKDALSIFRIFGKLIDNMDIFTSPHPGYSVQANHRKKEIIASFSKCRPFALDDAVIHVLNAKVRNREERKIKYTDQLFEPIALPFANCWFEAEDFHLFSTFAESHPGIDTQVSSILVWNSSNCIRMALVLNIRREGVLHDLRVFIEDIPYNKKIDFLHPIAISGLRFLSEFLNLQKSKLANDIININEHFKMGHGPERQFFKIKKMVRVILKQDVKKYETETGRTIDWSHRWEVMGHWRKVDGMGKSQDGEYTIEGFTWVVEHVKGPEDKILIPKSRNVITSSPSNPSPI